MTAPEDLAKAADAWAEKHLANFPAWSEEKWQRAFSRFDLTPDT